MTGARLHPDDLAALVDAVREEVRAALASGPLSALDGASLGVRAGEAVGGREDAAALVDAAAVAAALGVSRGMIYEHADRLGARRLGDGPKPRLRFDLAEAVAAWNRRDEGRGSDVAGSPSPPGRSGGRGSGDSDRLAGLLPVFALECESEKKSGPRDVGASGGRATRRRASPRREPTRPGSASGAAGRAPRARPTEGSRDG